MSVGSSIIRRYGDTDFVTGLRCVAILMVLLVHTGAFSEFGAIGQSVTDNGKFGVQIFFVIAGFTIYQNVSTSDYKQYLIRRIFRVVPVYYFFILIGFCLLWFDVLQPNYWMQISGAKPDFYNVAMHFSLISSWDDAIAASVIGVEWTIPVEVFWYVFLPLMVRPSDGAVKVFLAIVMLTLLSYSARKLLGSDYLNWGSRFSPLKYGLYFYLGYLSGSVRSKVKPYIVMHVVISAACVLFYAWLMVNYHEGNDAFFALITAALIVCVQPQSWLAAALTIRPFLFIGSVSYSFYLIHMIVIYLLGAVIQGEPLSNLRLFVVVFFITLCLSIVSYKFIELPSNRFGKRFATRF